jgi:hypothetical protein
LQQNVLLAKLAAEVAVLTISSAMLNIHGAAILARKERLVALSTGESVARIHAKLLRESGANGRLIRRGFRRH